MKRYLKKIKGISKPVVMKNPPVFGSIPLFNRGCDFMLDSVWLHNDGMDIKNRLDAFGDNSQLVNCKVTNGVFHDLLNSCVLTPNPAVRYGKDTNRLDINEHLMFDGVMSTDAATVATDVDLDYVLRKYGGVTVSMDVSFDENVYDRVDSWSTVLRTEAIQFGTSKGKMFFYLSGGEYVLRYDGDDVINIYPDKQVNVTFSVSADKTVKFYIDGELKAFRPAKDFNLKGNVSLGNWTSTQNHKGKIYTFNVFKKTLSDKEVREFTNRQLEDIKPYDNAQSYVQTDGKLLELDIDEDGNILDLGYDIFHPEILTNTAQFKEMMAKEAIVPGMIRRIAHNASTINASSSNPGTWVVFNRFNFTFDTSKYDYIVIINLQLQVNNQNNAGGANVNIRIDGTDVRTGAHIGHGLNMSATNYTRVYLATNKITTGFIGKKLLVASHTPYSTDCTNSTNSDNVSVGSTGRQNPNGGNISQFTIYEIYKGEPNG